EYTCFYAKVLNKDLPLAIDLLSDIFLNSRFDRREMDREKLVVLQEIKMVEDTPDDLIHDLFAERFWKGHPLGSSILGSSTTIEAIGRDDIAGYFRSHYHAGNVFVSAAGGLGHEKVTRLLKKTLGRLKKTGVKPGLSAPVPAPGVKIHRKKLEQVHLCLGVPAPAQPDPDRYKVYLLNTILGSGMSSRLFQEIREKRGLAYSVYSYLNLCADAGALVTYAGTSRETFSEVVSLIFKEYRRITKGVTTAELRNAREQLKGGMLLGLESSDSRMTKLARDEIYFGRTVPVKEIIREIDRVTTRGLKAAASKLFSPERLTLVAIGDVSERDLPGNIKKVLIRRKS
ncbi:MAG TPA: pitrilysin family protein, partial [Thermodesulfobacteriota bacterium]|nr:pitrilysin family protein [Thermodesulfobacteriota bacterium]